MMRLSVRERGERKRDTDGRGERWGIGKYERKKESWVKNRRGRNGAWRRERWNRKWGREREGWNNAFWQRWVQDGFMVTSWLIFEESIDRRAVHLSLDTHVGRQAERWSAGTHTPVAASTAFERTPKYAQTTHAHKHLHTRPCFYFLFVPLLSPLFSPPLFLLPLLLLFQALCSFVFTSVVHSDKCPSVPCTYISSPPWVSHFPFE